MMKGDIEKPKIETDTDWLPKDQNKWSTKFKKFDDGENGRLILDLNLTTEAPFFGVLEETGGPPLLVVVVRADMDIVALGTVERAKDSVKNFHRKKAALEQMKKPSILAPGNARLPPPPRVQ